MTFSAHDALLLLALLAAGAALLSLAPTLRIPYPILLVLGGLVLGFVPGIPHVALNPRIVLVAISSVHLVDVRWLVWNRPVEPALDELL